MFGRRPKKKLSSDGTPSAELLEGLSPAQREGMTEGLTIEQVAEARPADGAIDNLSHMRGERHADGTRLSNPHFVAENDLSGVFVDDRTGTLQQGYVKTYTREGFRQLQSGHQCLRCDELHPIAFPVLCDLCGYPMAERQVMDIAVEFEGMKHLGPQHGIGEYISEREAERERKEFDAKIAAGKSPMRGLRGG